jgi:ubiquinone/menaquinone biosynthesis C-methylase UbiE
VYPNWFETFFEGLALDMWRQAMTPELTRLEADFLAHHLQLHVGAEILDVPCGNGRLAVELARRGPRMTGVDISPGFLDDARRAAPGIEWIRGDMRDLPWTGRFDAAYCWGNSFAYFDHDECGRFLRAVARVLKPGGRFILESGAVAETLYFVLQPERALRVGDIDFLSRTSYDALAGRMDITYTFIRGDQREEKPIHQWVHSAAEIVRMLRAAGFELSAAFGNVDGSPFALRSQRLIIIVDKVN